MKKSLILVTAVMLVGCVATENTPDPPDVDDNNILNNADGEFEPRFNVDDLRRLETFGRPDNLPCRADVSIQFEEVASTKIESFGFDRQGRLSFVIDILNEGPQTKEIAFYEGDTDLVIARVVYSYDAGAPTQYVAYDYDEQDRLLRESRFRMTVDPDTMEWIPRETPEAFVDHGYPEQNVWRYNDRGVLFDITWDQGMGTLTTLQGQTVSTAFVDSDVSLAELTRLSTHLSPMDWTVQMDRAEFDETGDGTAEYSINYVYAGDRLMEIIDSDNSSFTYVYDCSE